MFKVAEILYRQKYSDIEVALEQIETGCDNLTDKMSLVVVKPRYSLMIFRIPSGERTIRWATRLFAPKYFLRYFSQNRVP